MYTRKEEQEDKVAPSAGLQAGARRTEEQDKGWTGAIATKQPGAVAAFAAQRHYRHGPKCNPIVLFKRKKHNEPRW